MMKLLRIILFYNGVFDDIGYFLQRAIHETQDHFIEKMEEDLANHRIYFSKLYLL